MPNTRTLRAASIGPTVSNPPNSAIRFSEHGTARAPAVSAGLPGGTVWSVPEEVPVALIYNRRNHAVMLATPGDLADFAVGFSLAEGIVRAPGEIEAIETRHLPAGVELHITLDPERAERFDLVQRRRTMPGRAGCGLCGLENADSLAGPLPTVGESEVEIAPEALEGALKTLADWQPLNARTRSVHAAAWADATGQILAAREDVGRHNALDKLIGALAQAGQDVRAGFVVMSSRCSYELVEKAARAGLPAIATLSAPTGLALRKAAEARIRLYARHEGRFVPVSCRASD